MWIKVKEYINGHIDGNVVALIVIIIVAVLVTILALVVNQDALQNRVPYQQSYDITKVDIPYTFYWINLDSARERYNNMQNLFNQYNIKNNRIEAIRGGPAQYDKEVACSKSHVKAIRTFYESNEAIGIICEDDLTMEYQKYWRHPLQEVIKNAPPDWEIIQLALIPCYCTDSNLICSCYPFAYVKGIKSTSYLPYHPWLSSALCYIINRRGAGKIATSNNAPTNIAENFLFMQVKTYTYKYPMFTYPTKNDSSLHPDHLYGHVLSKNTVTDYLHYI